MKDKKLILISLYHPNSALTNRFLAFVKAYGELGIDTKVYFVELNQKYERVQDKYENVEFVYVLSKFRTKNKYIRFLVTLLSVFYLLFKIEKDSKVIVYGLSDFLRLISYRKDFEIYHERTEHPDVVGRRKGIIGKFLYKQYLKSFKELKGLFVITPSLKDYFVSEIQLEEIKVHIINMVVDSKRFNSLEIFEMKNSITYCGTISIKKDGILTLIRSFNIISKIYNDIVLTIIGDFENSYTQDIVLMLVEELSLTDRVIFTGAVSSKEMPSLLASSKILALARPDNQQAKYGFATKLGEYLLSGVPSVITNVGDFHMFLKDRQNIIFAKPDDEVDFANQLIWTLENYEKANEIAENGREAALILFNYKNEAQKVKNIIFNKSQT